MIVIFYRILLCYVLDALDSYRIQYGSLDQQLRHLISNFEELQSMLRFVDFKQDQSCHYIDTQYVVHISRILLIQLTCYLLCLTNHPESLLVLLPLLVDKRQ